MATYVHPNAQAPNQRTNLSAGQPVTMHARYTLGPTLQANDIVQLFRVPQGARIRNAMVVAQKLDSGGTPAFSFQIGDAAGANHIFGTQTIGQAGGTTELAIGAAPKGYQFPTDDVVYLTVIAAAATQAAGAYLDVYLDVYEG